MGTDRGRYGSAAVSVRENRRKASLLQSGRYVLLASANTWRVAIPTDHREPTSATRHTAMPHAVSFCAAVWKRHVSHGHGTDLDWSETSWLRVRPYQRQHLRLAGRKPAMGDTGREPQARSDTAGKAHGGAARQ